MKLPRSLSGDTLVKILKKFGYEKTRQAGSHIRPPTAGELQDPNENISNTRIVSQENIQIGDIASYQIPGARKGATGHTTIYAGQVDIKQSVAGAGDGKVITHIPSKESYGTIGAGTDTVNYRDSKYLESTGNTNPVFRRFE